MMKQHHGTKVYLEDGLGCLMGNLLNIHTTKFTCNKHRALNTTK